SPTEPGSLWGGTSRGPGNNGHFGVCCPGSEANCQCHMVQRLRTDPRTRPSYRCSPSGNA
ncbi:hypothetical protein Cfor_07007, partial [Coptotermes formosanus]